MRIPLPLTLRFITPALLLLCAPALAQNIPAPMIPPIPPAPNIGPVPDVAPEIRGTLKMLHDRKDTLKNFTGKIDYNVTTKDGASGKRGSVIYVTDPDKGPTFSADFNIRFRIEDGEETKFKTYVQFIFDGREFTIKDMGLDGKSRNFIRSTVLPPGAKPGDAVTLNGAMTLPIGLDVDDVLRTFEVTKAESKNPNLTILKLVPRMKGHFDYTQLEITADKKQELPTVLVQTAPDGTVTTITLTDLTINNTTSHLTILSPATPASEGWTPRTGNGTP